MTKHQLLRVIRIQEVDLFFYEKGFSREYIHEKIIEPCFFVAKSTYYKYLGINAKSKLTNKGIDWKVESENKKPIDYMALMEILKNKDPFKLETYHEMLRDGGKH